MNALSRRTFLSLSALGAAVPALDAIARPAAVERAAPPPVDFTGDGIPLAPSEWAALLARLAAAPGAVETDEYSRGGAVAALEAWFARALGKETAVFVPSGTLANHLAVRALAGTRGRALVQADSHFYNDSGDCAQQLSRLNLVPLAHGRATIAADEVRAELERAAGGRVATQVGAISIESPVRRLHGATADLDEIARVATLARSAQLGLHLDGARLFVWAAYSGRTPAQLAAAFDTVYVSLWKCFNSGGGAILAGSKALLDELYQARRMFGGALWNAWPYAAVARHYAEGYLERLTDAVKVSEALIAALGADDRFRIERVPAGTSLFRIRASGIAPVAFRTALGARGVNVAPPDGDGFWLKVNETLHGRDPAALADAFRAAARAAG